jgi:hypothetical protein
MLTTLDAHNVLCKPLIEMSFRKKVVALVESFPTIHGMPLAHI